MPIEIGCARLTALGEHLRGEAIIPQLAGQGRGVERINRFYHAAAEAFLQHAADLRLPDGRYTARLCAEAEQQGDALLVRINLTFCCRGRVLDAQTYVHRWQLSRGNLQPEVADASRRQEKV